MAPTALALDAAANPTSPYAVLDQLLDGLAEVLLDLPAQTYVAVPLPAVSGSIGGHVRHTLDHIAAFAVANPHDTLTYDARVRGTAVETDPAAALQTIDSLRRLLSAQATASVAQPVVVASTIAASGESISGASTLARELAFVVSHTVHHEALIATLLAVQGLQAPRWFGYSPSTPRSES